MSVPFCTSVSPVSGGFHSSDGPVSLHSQAGVSAGVSLVSGRCQSSFAPASVQFWARVSPVSGRCQSSFRPVSVQFRASVSPVSGRFQSRFGQVQSRSGQFQSSFKPVLVHFSAGVSPVSVLAATDSTAAQGLVSIRATGSTAAPAKQFAD